MAFFSLLSSILQNSSGVFTGTVVAIYIENMNQESEILAAYEKDRVQTNVDKIMWVGIIVMAIAITLDFALAFWLGKLLHT